MISQNGLDKSEDNNNIQSAGNLKQSERVDSQMDGEKEKAVSGFDVRPASSLLPDINIHNSYTNVEVKDFKHESPPIKISI